MSSDKDNKPELMAIYHLKFYKNKKKWKLSDEKYKIPAAPSGVVAEILKPESDNILDKTFKVEIDPAVEKEKNSPLNSAYIHEIPIHEELQEAKDAGPPTPQPSDEAETAGQPENLWIKDQEDTSSLQVLQNSQDWCMPAEGASYVTYEEIAGHNTPVHEELQEAKDAGPPTPQPSDEAETADQPENLWIKDQEDTSSLQVLQNSQEPDTWTNPTTEDGPLVQNPPPEYSPQLDLIQDKHADPDWTNQTKPIVTEIAQDDWIKQEMTNLCSKEAALLKEMMRDVPPSSLPVFLKNIKDKGLIGSWLPTYHQDWCMPAEGASDVMYEEIAGHNTPVDQETLKPQHSMDEMQTPTQIRKNTEKWLRRLLAIYGANGDVEDDQAHNESINFIREAHEVPHSSENDPNESHECICSFVSPAALPALPSQVLASAILHATKSLQAVLKEQLIRDQLREHTLMKIQEFPTRDVEMFPELKDGSHLPHPTTELEKEKDGLIRIAMGRPYRLANDH